jgi:hypothetical protein
MLQFSHKMDWATLWATLSPTQLVIPGSVSLSRDRESRFSSSQALTHRQGDPIGRILACWAIVVFGRLLSLGDCCLWAIVVFGRLLSLGDCCLWAIFVFGRLLSSGSFF